MVKARLSIDGTMSTRTKSFFDQNHNNKVSSPSVLADDLLLTLLKPRPGQWHRNQNRAPLNESSSNSAPPAKPPIPATSESKSKLKAFQFVPGHPTDPQTTAGKENEQQVNDVDMSDTKQGSLAVVDAESSKGNEAPAGENKITTSAPQLQHAHTFPCTPGTRLPLEDLIGNFDEHAKKPAPQNESPEEHLGWIPNSSSTLLTPNRKRKRARSSSPSCQDSSSQRQEASAFFPGNGVAVEGDEQMSADVDPSVDLWQRYGAEKRAADGDSNLPAFSHLMFQASPRLHETPAKGSGLRRWASTGNDWPTSKSKRRRMVNGRTSTSMLHEGQAVESGEKSKFVDMLTKVEESLATQKLAKQQTMPAVRIEGPSSSSPLPEVGAPDAFDAVPAASPLQTKQTLGAPKSANLQVQNGASTITKGAVQQPLATLKNTIRLNTNPPAQAPDSVISAPLCLQSKAPLPAYKRPSITRTPSDSARQQPAAQPAPAIPAMTEDFDEFGDDLELTAEDLDELMSQPPTLDRRSLHQIPQHPNPPPQQEISVVEQDRATVPEGVIGCAAQPILLNDDDFDDDEEDEFGMDDIDEASFAQAEMSATQAFRASHPSSYIPNVKIR